MTSLQFSMLMLMLGAIVGVLVTLVVIVWGHLSEASELLDIAKDYYSIGKEHHDDAKTVHDDAVSVKNDLVPRIIEKVDQVKEEVVDKVVEKVTEVVKPLQNPASAIFKGEDLRGT